MARASFVNSCPRFASVAFFLCLIEAHLEWPDTGPECRRRGGNGSRDAPAPSLGQQAAWARTAAQRLSFFPRLSVTFAGLTTALPCPFGGVTVGLDRDLEGLLLLERLGGLLVQLDGPGHDASLDVLLRHATDHVDLGELAALEYWDSDHR